MDNEKAGATNSIFSRDYLAAVAVMCVIMMNVLDTTIVNVALPTLAQCFGVSDTAITWVANSYLMLIPMLMLSFSLAGDVWGYKRMFVIGTVLFGLGSLVCGMSLTFAQLIAGRMMQGVGAAGVMSVNTALVRIIFPREKLPIAMGVNAMVVAVSSAAGPTLAGVILHFLSWQWMFFINVPVAVIAIVIGVRLLPRNPASQGGKARFHWSSAIMNFAFFGLMLHGLDEFAQHGFSATAGIEVALGTALGIVYMHRQTRIATPLFPVDLMRNSTFALSVGTSICSYTAQSLAYVSLPFFLHYVMHYQAVAIGAMITPWPLATVITAPLAGKLVCRFRAGIICTVGMLLLAIGFALLLLMHEGSPAWQMAATLALCGVGFGLFQTPNNVTLVSSAPTHRSGGASGMLGTARVIGQTVGTTLAALMLRLFTDEQQASACLVAGIAMAIAAAIVSSMRLKDSGAHAASNNKA